MKKILFLCLVLIFAIISCVNAHGVRVNKINGLAKTSIIEKALVSTVGLYSLKEKTINCAGFFVAPNLVASARHCVTGDKFPILATTRNSDKLIEKVYFGRTVYGIKYEEHLNNQIAKKYSKHFEMEIVYMTAKYNDSYLKTYDDIVILKVKNKKDYSKNWFPIAKKDPDVGQKIYTVGMPLGMDWTVFEGIISKHMFFSNIKIVKMYYLNLFVAPGSSGGPVFNHHGKAVGVISSGFFSNTHSQSEFSISMARYRLYQHVFLAKKLINNKYNKAEEHVKK